jgi:hypothetical protein
MIFMAKRRVTGRNAYMYSYSYLFIAFLSYRHSKVNPFGIAFHPLPLARSLHRLASETLYTAADLNFTPTTAQNARAAAAEGDSNHLKEAAGVYYSLDHHTKYSHPDAAQCLSLINADLVLGARQLRHAKFLFVTLGTSWGYSLIVDDDGPHEEASNDKLPPTDTAAAEAPAVVSAGRRLQGNVVANCHRLPGQRFAKHMSSPGDTAAALRNALVACQRVNPGLQVVLTVSPVRHWRDGAAENSRSKASLLLAVDDLVRRQPSDTSTPSDVNGAAASSDRSEGLHRVSRCDRASQQRGVALPERYVSYFPSYELVLDDLRDYRFFNPDMLHPSEVRFSRNIKELKCAAGK